ncbi:uncharacterized protein LOC123553836 [Mercenaria mercenaria]|uniref:uncharacterized protein LOC123553836 n=1 Tax=Mercenaria mercenaria TaxID=6596 RepID=UPI00234EFB61|nr:uncharacterized protein LOC123553836 [Mercenaria mercenaria]
MVTDDTRNNLPATKYVPVLLERSQAPKGAVQLTTTEILTIQLKRLERCKSTSEKSAFRFGPHITAGATAITAILVNTHFRTKFYLFNYGLMLSYLPVVIVPSFVTLVLNEYLTKQVLLQPKCMECLEVRSGVLQVAASVLYSSIIAPTTSILLSKKYHTYLIKNNFQPNVKHALKSTSFSRFCFLALIVQNFCVGAFVRYKQGKQLENIMAQEPANVSRQLLEQITD